MPNRHVVFLTAAAAVVLRARIANRLGYPKPGLDIGEGLHVTAAESQTDFYTNFRRHPSLSRWALFVDNIARPHLRAGDVEEDLTPDWDEARPT